MRLLAILSLILLATPSLADPVDRVILISVDGLRADLASKGGLLIVDVFNPSTPFVAGTHAMPGSARSVAVAGDFAYVAAILGEQNNAIFLALHGGIPGNLGAPNAERRHRRHGQQAQQLNHTRQHR